MRVFSKQPKPVSVIAGRIGQRIFDRRAELGMTQQAVRSKAGLSAAFFCDVENGKSRISAENLDRIAMVLGVSLDYFVEEERHG